MTSPRLAVVIPAHDEEQLLAACLGSVSTAVDEAQAAGATVDVVVVLDACTDRSAQIALSFPVHVVEIAARSVGTARRRGTLAALRRPHGRVPDWIAHTDADTVVPPNWLTHQRELLRGGADLMIGTVRPDFADLSAEHVALWHATHTPGKPNGHVHGANLGIRTSVYRAVGGFPQLREHEDVALVDAARRAGARIVASDACEVVTSGRFAGRTPGGYASYLRDQDAALSTPSGLDAVAPSVNA